MCSREWSLPHPCSLPSITTDFLLSSSVGQSIKVWLTTLKNNLVLSNSVSLMKAGKNFQTSFPEMVDEAPLCVLHR